MAVRLKLDSDTIEKDPEPLSDGGEDIPKGNYFSQPNSSLEFIPSGCCLLDCSIGGGWPLGRISNVVGDKSSGKTLLSIEASANFIRKYPKGKIFYREAESAFDESYAEALGMPINQVEFVKDNQGFETVEDLYEDLDDILPSLIKTKTPSLYVIDSYDALSDRSEMDREIDKGSYGANKAKMSSQLFRRKVRDIELARMHLMVISQVRDNIGVTFGATQSRSGGRALDFYSSLVVWLSKIKNIEKTKKGVKRVVGIEIKTQCKKNKIATPMREAYFDILFGYGIYDLGASVEWLADVKRLDVLNTNDSTAFIKQVESLDDNDYWSALSDVNQKVKDVWYEIEGMFLPTRRKY